MISSQTGKSKSARLLGVVLVLLGSGMCLCKAKDGESALGELKLEGQHVERLVLRRSDGHTETLNDPDETVKLPIGQYLVKDVRLKGGYTRQTLLGSQNKVTISESATASLKVGVPLKQTVAVKRRGSILELSYSLLGADGNTYAVAGDRSKPPAFTIYKGSREIATGKFEFG